MTDEWEVQRLDLDAYLSRVGYRGRIEPNGETLTALHRAHIGAFPFENLDLILGRGIEVDLGSVQDKLVADRRGGYCYEHGVLFGAVLARVGFAVDRLLARIGGDEQRPRPRTHMALRVAGEGGEWLADVGFGDGLLDPLPWDSSGQTHRQGNGWLYQLLATAPGAWQVRQVQGDRATVLYSFTEEPQHFSDVVMSNHFTSTHPGSPFVGQLVAMRKTPHEIRRLRDRLLTISRPDGSSRERGLDEDAVAEALREDFHIPLDGAQLRAVRRFLASAPPRG